MLVGKEAFCDCLTIQEAIDALERQPSHITETLYIRSLHHINQQPGYITAASTPEGQEHGFVFNQCYLTAENEVSDVYLERPWREHAKTDFVNCRMGRHIDPCGWDNWNDPAHALTTRYREFGVPDDPALWNQRVSWAECLKSAVDAPRKEQVFAGNHFWKQEGDGQG